MHSDTAASRESFLLGPPGGAGRLVVDLHSHTNLSDGALSPTELVAAASKAGVHVLAVTDHDNMHALPEAQEEANRRGLRLLPGMEISSEIAGKNLHLLAYFRPSAPPDLASWQAERRQARVDRLGAMLDKLRGLGIDISLESVLHGSDPRRPPGRPHLARALLEAGHVGDYQEAFRRYLGRNATAYVQGDLPSADAVIELVHSWGGLVVVAHPDLDDLDTTLEELVLLGVDGVEAYHACHSRDVAAYYHRRSQELGVLVTGGSDYHGRLPVRGKVSEAEGPGLGDVALPVEEWERLVEALYRSTLG